MENPSLTSKKRYLIHELAEISGVTPRTIRYYTDVGLLPPPYTTEGRYALYGEEHLERLEVIRRLKEAFLPLREIHVLLNTLNAEQLREFLDQIEHTRQETPSKPGESALRYIDAIRKGEVPIEEPAEEPFYDPRDKIRVQRLLYRLREETSDPDTASPNCWERIVVTPDVEVHIRVGSDPLVRSKVNRLIEFIHRLFRS